MSNNSNTISNNNSVELIEICCNFRDFFSLNWDWKKIWGLRKLSEDCKHFHNHI